MLFFLSLIIYLSIAVSFQALTRQAKLSIDRYPSIHRNGLVPSHSTLLPDLGDRIVSIYRFHDHRSALFLKGSDYNTFDASTTSDNAMDDWDRDMSLTNQYNRVHLDLSNLNISKFYFGKSNDDFDLSKLDGSKIDSSKLEIPKKYESSKFELFSSRNNRLFQKKSESINIPDDLNPVQYDPTDEISKSDRNIHHDDNPSNGLVNPLPILRNNQETSSRRSLSMSSSTSVNEIPKASTNVHIPSYFYGSKLAGAKVNQAKALTYFSDREEDMLTIVYFKKVLKISDDGLKSILLHHSWILHLRVKSLIPKVNYLKTYGFKDKDIRKLVEYMPSVLAMNYQHSIPQKLLCLQKYFNLSKANVIAIVVSQPYVISCSAQRNIDIAEYLRHEIDLSLEEIKFVLLQNPRILSIGLVPIQESWKILTETYAFDKSFAKTLILRNTYLLSPRMHENIHDRLELIASLGLDIKSHEFNRVIVRSPSFLLVNVNYFLRPNMLLLQKLLQLSEKDLIYMIKICPSFLSYNPRTLRSKINSVLYFLTGDASIADPSLIDMDPSWNETSIGIHETILDELSSTENLEMQDDMLMNCYNISSFDVLSDISKQFNSSIEYPHMIIKDINSMQLMISTLSLSSVNANILIKKVPWIIQFRSERTRRVLIALMITLGLTKDELIRIISIYPRIFNYSIEGKVSSFLNVLASLAIEYLRSPIHATEIHQILSESMESPAYEEYLDILGLEAVQSLQSRRNDPIRTLLRHLLLKLPILLGFSIDRINRRIDTLLTNRNMEDKPRSIVSWKKMGSFLRICDETNKKKEMDDMTSKAKASADMTNAWLKSSRRKNRRLEKGLI